MTWKSVLTWRRGEPLSIIIPGFPGWLAEQQGKPSPAPQAPVDYDTARKYLALRLRMFPELTVPV